MNQSQRKPKTRFCWACMEQLHGNHHKTMIIDGHERILHKKCAEIIQKGGEIRTKFEAAAPSIKGSKEPEFIDYFIDQQNH